MARGLLIFFITLIFGILEISVFSYPLAFLWVICFSVVNGSDSLYLAFVSGLYTDFLKGEYIGKTSSFFLIFSFLIALYKRKFKVIHPLYFFPFVAGSVLIFNFWEARELRGFEIPYSLVAAVVLFKIAERIIKKSSSP